VPGFGEVLGKTGEAAWQLFVWQIGAQILGAALTPYLTELTYLVNDAHPDVVLDTGQLAELAARGLTDRDGAIADARKLGLDTGRFTQLVDLATPRLSPPDLAVMVVRHILTEPEAAAEAAQTGTTGERFRRMVQLAGEAPGPEALAEALRRGLIQEGGTGPDVVSFVQGIAETALRDKYAPMVKALAVQWPSWQEALNAELQGQLTHEQALAEYTRLGGDPQFYTWVFNTRGTAPSPVELGVLARRRIIPWEGTGPDVTSFQQGILEGPSRNKWLPSWRALSDYIPPPRTVTAMLKEGAYTTEQAAQRFADNGLKPDDVAAYIDSATQQKTAAHKELTLAQLTQLYQDQLIGLDTYRQTVGALGYPAHDIDLLAALADMRWQITAMTTATGRVHTLYVSWKITRDEAAGALTDLGTPADRARELIDIWSIERRANTKDLTAAEIAGLLHYEIIGQADAQQRLEQIGYLPHDAWLYLSQHEHKALPDEPAAAG
jgi:hypothetical protein